jgi:ATP-binding cassette subfamily B protein
MPTSGAQLASELSAAVPGQAAPSALPAYASHGAVRFLAHYVLRRALSHGVVLIAVVAAVACAIGAQYAVKHLVDVMSGPEAARDALWWAVGLLLVVVAGDNLLWRVAGWVSTYAFPAVGADLRLDLFNHLSGHGTRYFVEQFPGALASRITTAANAAWTIESSLTWNTIPPALAVLFSIAVLGAIDGELTLVLVVIVIALGGMIAWIAARGVHLHERFAGTAAHVSGDLTDVVNNIGLVRVFGSAQREQERLERKIGDEIEAQRASLQSLERLRLLHAVSVFAVTAGVLVRAVYLWQQGQISTGDVVLTTSLGFTVLHASRDFAMSAVDLIQQFAKLREAVAVLGLPHEMKDAPNAAPLRVRRGDVVFRNVSFRYPNGQLILSGFTLEVPAGQRVGLVGRSGAGKSTLLALLQRFYDPDQGEVVIDGQNIATVTQQSLREALAIVQQDISLFHRSILENLRYGRPEASDEEVYRAVEAAHCTEFINGLPQGFDTVVGERGTKLSGGQRQRLAIARAFLRDAPIVLLDEATSALDTESEQSIQEALARLCKGRTVIAIAHRLSTLDSFDRIVVLDRGRIVEEGPPRQLLARDGPYAQMYRRQLSAAGRAHAHVVHR